MKAIAYLSLTVTLSLGLALASPATAHPLTTQLAQAAASVGQTASDGDRYPVTSPAVTSGASAPPIIAPPSARFAPLGSAPTSRDGMGRLPSVAAAPRPFSSSGRPLAGGRVVSHPAKDRASQLVFQAQQQLLRGELESALRLAEQAQRLQVPKEAFGPQEMRPWQVLMEGCRTGQQVYITPTSSRLSRATRDLQSQHRSNQQYAGANPRSHPRGTTIGSAIGTSAIRARDGCIGRSRSRSRPPALSRSLATPK